VPTTRHKDSLNFQKQPSLSSALERGLLHVLNETPFLDYANNLIESAVLFAKNVPYFMSIHESDRITLLKACVFEIILVRHASCHSDRPSPTPDSLDTLAAVAAASTSDQRKSQLIESLDSDERDSWLWLPGCEVWASCKWLGDKIPQLRRFIQLLATFYQTFNAMGLDCSQVAVFCAYLLYDRSKTKGERFCLLLLVKFG